MSNITTDPIKQMSMQLFDLNASITAIAKRITRIESRLTQLMLYEGMSNDGRTSIGEKFNGKHFD